MFERRQAGRYRGALVVLTIRMGLLNVPVQIALATAIEAEFRRGIEVTGAAMQMEAAQLEQLRSTSVIVGSVAALFILPVAVILTGAVLWGIAGVFELGIAFAAAVMIATYAVFPRIALSLTSTVQGVSLDPGRMNEVSLGPARFVDSDTISPVLLAAQGRVDLFTLWSVLLIGLGVRVVGRATVGQAAAVAAGVWFLSLLPALAAPVLMALRG